MSRIEQLEQIIKQAQNDYYNGTPSMPDAEFDQFWDELVKLNPTNVILTDAIGEDHTDGFKKAKHLILMGSQSKANTEGEMKVFFGKITGAVQVSYKMDGISLELNYKNGKLIQAITRGNGEVGDDITENVMKMNYIPHQLSNNFTGAVRGEILLSRSNKEKYFPEAKNCRNQASGISKRLDGTGCEYLDAVCYDAQYLDGTSFETWENLMLWLSENGFKTATYKLMKKPTASEAMSYLDETFAKFDNLEYDIDGLVFKQNEIDMNDLKTNLRPKTCIALKPAKVAKRTKVIDIEWNMKNGTLTPIAIFEPIELQGSTVSRASLSNVNCILDLGLEIGHEVSVIKANMIIPKVIFDYNTNKVAVGY